jgi:hypothetical protein
VTLLVRWVGKCQWRSDTTPSQCWYCRRWRLFKAEQYFPCRSHACRLFCRVWESETHHQGQQSGYARQTRQTAIQYFFDGRTNLSQFFGSVSRCSIKHTERLVALPPTTACPRSVEHPSMQGRLGVLHAQRQYSFSERFTERLQMVLKNLICVAGCLLVSVAFGHCQASSMGFCLGYETHEFPQLT